MGGDLFALLLVSAYLGYLAFPYGMTLSFLIGTFKKLTGAAERRFFPAGRATISVIAAFVYFILMLTVVMPNFGSHMPEWLQVRYDPQYAKLRPVVSIVYCGAAIAIGYILSASVRFGKRLLGMPLLSKAAFHDIALTVSMVLGWVIYGFGL